MSESVSLRNFILFINCIYLLFLCMIISKSTKQRQRVLMAKFKILENKI